MQKPTKLILNQHLTGGSLRFCVGRPVSLLELLVDTNGLDTSLESTCLQALLMHGDSIEEMAIHYGLMHNAKSWMPS